MKDLYVRDLQPNQIIVSAFLVQTKDVRFKRTGEGYLSLLLVDKTGEVEAKVWENVEELSSQFERDDFVKVKGAVQVFRTRPQLTIHKVRRLELHEVDLTDFFQRSARDPDEMWRELEGIVAEIENPHLRALLSKIIADPEIAARLKDAPAAKSLHHAYLGGLLEHNLSLCRLAKLVLQNYPGVSKDLVLSGVVLHDLGKIYELSYDRSFGYTTGGQLLGHMILEIEILHRMLRDMPDFPRPLQTLLEHLIISHHGQYEFGSSKLPMFPEALVLHYIDDLDSKMAGMLALLEKEKTLDGDWTGFLPSLGRTILKVSKFLEGNSSTASPAGSTVLAAPAEAANSSASRQAPAEPMLSLAASSDGANGQTAAAPPTVIVDLKEKIDLLREKLRGPR